MAMDLQYLLLVPLFLFSFSLCFTFLTKKQHKHKGYTIYPIIGTLPGFVRNKHRILEWVTNILSQTPTNTFIIKRPGFRGVTTANPANVEHILKTNFENYPKGVRFISFLEDFLGKGIFNTDAYLWKIQRKTASFEFNARSLRNFVIETVREELQSRLLPLMLKYAKDQSQETIDLQDVLERFAFDNVCKVVFNENLACLNENGNSGGEFMKAFEDATLISSGRFFYWLPYLWQIKKLFNVGSEKLLSDSIAIVHKFADKIVKARLAMKMESDENSDLLSRFIAKDESSNSPEFLRDIIINFILAGRDTTSSALTWFFWILSSHPDVEKNILDELKTIREHKAKSVEEPFDLDELREMHYLHASITESMRLYPPVAVDTKCCLKDDVLPDGTFVGKGWNVSYNTYAMGRMKSIWGKDCREFVPDRWLENGVFKPESMFKYPIFHAGPRMCLGKDMAYIQMKTIAATVIERFEIDVMNKCPEHNLSLTLRMKNGLMVKVREREGCQHGELKK